MGLYKLITQKLSSEDNSLEEKNKHNSYISKGLLRKSELIRKFSSMSVDTPFIMFHSFAEELNLERAGILFPYAYGHSMIYSHGLDRETVWLFCSETNLWKDLSVNHFGWFVIEGDTLQDFFCFFSQKEQENLEKIYVKPFLFSKNKTGFLIILESALNTYQEKPINIDTIDNAFSTILDVIEITDIILPEIPIYSSINQSKDTVINTITTMLDTQQNLCMLQCSLSPIFKLFDKKFSFVDSEILFAGAFNTIKQITNGNIIAYAYKLHIIRAIISGDIDLFKNNLIEELSLLFKENIADIINIEIKGTSSNREELSHFLIRNN